MSLWNSSNLSVVEPQCPRCHDFLALAPLLTSAAPPNTPSQTVQHQASCLRHAFARVQAESVAQLIDARTVAAADSALAGLAGGLGREVQEMRAECIDLLTEMDVR